MAIKKLGIACDNYKQSKFETELKKAGFNDYEITKLNTQCKFIKIKVDESKIMEVKKVCQMVELHFKHRN